MTLQISNIAYIKDWLPMHGSTALGAPLVKAGGFAADLLKFEPKQKTEPHTHPGDHILFVVDGVGWLIYAGSYHALTQHTCYLVPGQIVHQVGSESGMLLMSIASAHRPVDSPERLQVTPCDQSLAEALQLDG